MDVVFLFGGIYRHWNHAHTQALCLFVAACKVLLSVLVALWQFFVCGGCCVVAPIMWMVFSLLCLYDASSLLIHAGQQGYCWVF